MNTQTISSAAEKSIANDTRFDNNETMEVFSETADTEVSNNDRQRLCAHTLFSSFTAGIIKENTLFTR